MPTESSTSPPWYPALIDWIRSAGGHVHESLILTNQDGMRGIACGSPISKDELLIRLPPALALSGESMPATYSNSKHASPWLQCLAALHQAYNSETFSWKPYLDSLFDDYEHLLEWPDEHVDEYLQGTTLGRIVKEDRSQNTLEKRFATAVRPYLVHISTCGETRRKEDTCIKKKKEELQLCMCISTRGFHLQSTCTFDDTTTQQQEEQYLGPFLLPFIDLLNHNPAQACTTLKRHDETGAFYMIAERSVQTGEQVFHSYGRDLSSAQVLQTFGFVPEEAIQRAARWNATTGMDEKQHVGVVTTAAIVSRDNIREACRQMQCSGYPAQVVAFIEKNVVEEETWEVLPAMLNREMDLVPNDFVVTYSETPLSNELVTLCTLLLLPDETYDEFMSDSPALLDLSILQDYFLGKLVCRTLLNAIDNKKKEYGNDVRVDANKLRQLSLECGDRTRSTSDLRAMYGLTIRIEEMACLEKLRKQVLELMDSLDDNDCEGSDNGDANGKRKRDS